MHYGSQDRFRPLLWIDLLSVRGFFLLLGVAVLLCWPMLILQPPVGFFDTDAYFNRGFQIFEIIGRMLPFGADAGGMAGGGSALSQAEEAGARSLRSVPYSVFTYATQYTPLGFFGTAVVQTVMVLLVLGGAIGRVPTLIDDRAVLLFLVAVFLTALPWFASFIMPDMFAAAIILYAVVLVNRFDDLRWLQRSVLALIVAWAIMCHYAHILLAVGALGTSLGLRLLQWRLRPSVLAFGVAQLILAVAANALFGMIAFQSTSVAPKRLPILLRALQEYPAEQIGWLLYNSADQFVSYGLEDFGQVRLDRLENGRVKFAFTRDRDRTVFVAFNIVHWLVLLAALAVAGVMFYRREFRPEDRAGSVYLVILATLVANAVIYGGLSEPADRYQTRLVWVVPVLTAVFWLRRRKA